VSDSLKAAETEPGDIDFRLLVLPDRGYWTSVRRGADIPVDIRKKDSALSTAFSIPGRWPVGLLVMAHEHALTGAADWERSILEAPH
jgi:hypothetical protein